MVEQAHFLFCFKVSGSIFAPCLLKYDFPKTIHFSGDFSFSRHFFYLREGGVFHFSKHRLFVFSAQILTCPIPQWPNRFRLAVHPSICREMNRRLSPSLYIHVVLILILMIAIISSYDINVVFSLSKLYWKYSASLKNFIDKNINTSARMPILI